MKIAHSKPVPEDEKPRGSHPYHPIVLHAPFLPVPGSVVLLMSFDLNQRGKDPEWRPSGKWLIGNRFLAWNYKWQKEVITERHIAQVVNVETGEYQYWDFGNRQQLEQIFKQGGYNATHLPPHRAPTLPVVAGHVTPPE